jgi:hypothetical protein
VVEKIPDQKLATEELLKRTTRHEIFWNIGLEELLHYLVTFNTGQRSMSVQVQLEIMRKPLLDALEHDAKITILRTLKTFKDVRSRRITSPRPT